MDHLQQHLEENVTHMRTRKAERRNREQQDNAQDSGDTDEEQEEEEREEIVKRPKSRGNTLRQTSGKYCPPEVLARAESGQSDGILLGKWICRLCSSTFPGINILMKHLSSYSNHAKEDETRNRCQTCHQRFRSFKDFRKHLGREPSHMRILPHGSSESHYTESYTGANDKGATMTSDLGAEDDSADDMEVEPEAEEGVAYDDDEGRESSWFVSRRRGHGTSSSHTASNVAVYCRHSGSPMHGPSAKALKQEMHSSEDSDTTEESESEEEIIELGENQDVEDRNDSMDIVIDERIPVAKSFSSIRQTASLEQDSREEDSSEEDNSEDDSSADDCDLEDNTRKVARVLKEREPLSVDAPPVRRRRSSEQKRDTSSSTSTSDITVKVEDTQPSDQYSTAANLHRSTNTLPEGESERVLSDRSLLKVEEIVRVSDGTKTQLRGSRDRIDSFNWHYACSHCDRTFNTPDTLLTHLRGVDKIAKWYTCGSCNRGFATAEPFKAHLAEFSTHMRVGSVEVAPASTSVGFHDQVQHVRQDQSQGHNGLDRRHKSYCATCDQTYKSIDHLIKHRRRYHKSAPFKCMTCLKDFPAGVYLKYHLLEHTDHMQVVLEAVVPGTVTSRPVSTTLTTPRTKPKEGTASAIIELSSDSESESEMALGLKSLKSRRTITLGGKAKIRVSKRQLPEEGSTEASASKKAKVPHRRVT
ncbi:hypothetical protein QFC20_007631 [Naganishia adeliensis]|uniref:Uncharacterized protein n=1 Tax=Naganishia adeliensis TaxID=92952 RepID=A0ACC2UXU6_9TREE|nr:hypothetical protein QFC20_007631 [Naganishia adeliensis]